MPGAFCPSAARTKANSPTHAQSRFNPASFRRTS